MFRVSVILALQGIWTGDLSYSHNLLDYYNSPCQFAPIAPLSVAQRLGRSKCIQINNSTINSATR
jgi:hypothetical protein